MNPLKRLRQLALTFARARQFNPGIAGIAVTPFFLARRALWNNLVDVSKCVSGRLLDVGCGTMPYRSLFSVQHYVGLEIDSEQARTRNVADFFYDGTTFPFESDRFDGVLCNQVLEHVFNPIEFLSEIHRVLKPDGTLILTVPFVWDEHEQPFDYARYTSFGLSHLLKKAGFHIQIHRKTLGNAAILLQLLNAYLFKTIAPRRAVSHAALGVLLFAPVSLIGLVVGALLPANSDLFLDHVVVAKRTEQP